MKKLKIIISIAAVAAVCGAAALYLKSEPSNNKEDSAAVVSSKEETSDNGEENSEKDVSNTTKNDSKETEAITSNNKTDNSTKEKEVTDSNDKTSNSSKKEDNNKQEWFSGKWGNAKRIKTGNVTADDGEGIDNIMQKPIEFKSSTATYNEKNYTNVKYTAENISNEEFSQGYRSKVTFEMLGISGSDVETINIQNYDNVDIEGNEIIDLYGTTLYKKGDNTIIMCKGGNFFELTRK